MAERNWNNTVQTRRRRRAGDVVRKQKSRYMENANRKYSYRLFRTDVSFAKDPESDRLLTWIRGIKNINIVIYTMINVRIMLHKFLRKIFFCSTERDFSFISWWRFECKYKYFYRGFLLLKYFISLTVMQFWQFILLTNDLRCIFIVFVFE